VRLSPLGPQAGSPTHRAAALRFGVESPENEDLGCPFFEAGVRPAFLLVETLQGDPARAPLGLQVWGGTQVPTPEEARTLLGKHGVVCRVGDLSRST
jgi:hypothetical protein